jgi:phage terminase Nu1 subunit (DNA packaging protein)
MVINKITFADLAGVGKASVTLSVQRGKLVETADGFIDTEHPTNKAYLEKRRSAVAPDQQNKPLKKPKQPKKRVQKATTKLETIETLELPEPDVEIQDEPKETDGPDQLDKLAVDVRLKTAQAKRHELKYEQDKGLLIPVESVERAAAKVGSEIKIRLQDMPRRIAPRILAMAASGASEREVQEALECEIDSGIEAIRQTLGGQIV